MEKLKEICELRHRFISVATAELNCKSLEDVNTSEMGAVVDMIKDLAEAEEKIVKARYYCVVMEAMEEYDEEDGERMGYNHRRYSSGRFAPKGKGHVSGFIPDDGERKPWDVMYERMGFHEPTHIDMWRDARRHYQETKSKDDKDKMNEHAKHHLTETLATLKEIMANSDPELQRKMKNDLNNFINDMI